MAQLVVQGHAYTAQAGAAKPCSVYSGCTGCFGRSVFDNFWQASCQFSDSVDCNQIYDGICIASVQCFDLQGAPSLLDAIFCFSENGSHFATFICRRDGDVWEARTDADCLAQPNNTASPYGNQVISTWRLYICYGFICDICGCMHSCLGEKTGNFLLKNRFEVFGLVDLLWF